MANKLIYTDGETEEILKSLRSKEPNFNLSGFVKEKLIARVGGFAEDEKENIQHNIETEKTKVQFHLDNVEFWKKKLVKHEIILEEKKEQELQRTKLLLAKEEKEKIKMSNIKQIFQEEMGREMSEQELNNYLSGKFPNIYSFCKYTQQLKGGNNT